MPRRYRRKRKRRTTRKRKTRRTKIPMPLGGFPNSKTVKLRWVKPVKIDAGANSHSISQFRANGLSTIQLNDVHQPANFDIWARRYTTYCVLGSKLTAQLTPDSLSSVVPGYVGIYLTQNDTELATLLTNGIANAMEQKNAVKMTPISYLQANARRVQKGYSPTRLFGIPRQGVLIDDNFQGNKDNNPAAAAYYQLFVAAIDGNNPGEMDFLVTIDYTVKFTGLLQQSPS